MLDYNGMSFWFNRIGLFTIDEDWIHPPKIQPTYEMIYVTNGTVFIEEETVKYILKPKDVLILDANKHHKGFKHSQGLTSFYWAHFVVEHDDGLVLPKYVPHFDEPALFKELLHYGRHTTRDQLLLDSLLMYIIAKLYHAHTLDPVSRSAREIYAWTKINASATLTVQDIADHFKYSPEHITRIMKKNYHKNLKAIIADFIIKQANDLLCNSNHSIKEIADILSFSSANAFINFYKYHEEISPSKFRNKYSFTYMNNK